MQKKMDNITKNSIGRLIVVSIFLLLQITWILVLFFNFKQSSVWISTFFNVLAMLIVLEIVNKLTNAAFKLPWVILILITPMAGLILYLMTCHSGITKKRKDKLFKIGNELRSNFLNGDSEISLDDENKSPYSKQLRYIKNDSAYPAYNSTKTEFYGDTCKALDALVDELSKAKKFIFMEYHAIEYATAFERILSVLKERVANGVEVRIIYDDIGSVGFINPKFNKQLCKLGIQCRVFNPIMPVINVFMNNRDHRKITIIDGRVGFTGGYNLADEYFNIVHPYGEWKDSGLKLEGCAVKSLTVQFLEMWNTIENTDKKFDCYFPKVPPCSGENGIVQPYGDCPLDDIYLGENVYMNMISDAKNYIWFMTPYLIISDEMSRMLTLAAKKGIDVRIVTPGIPDKRFVYRITRSYYHQLVKSGVRIYEFTPGFLHSKQCICDGKSAVVGTINLDYRSLYFHFENAVFMADCSAVQDVKKDFDETLPRCREVTENYCNEIHGINRIINQIIRLFAPLF